MTSPKCLRHVRWLVSLQDLIQDAYWQQDNPDVKNLLREWKHEKDGVTKSLKGAIEFAVLVLHICWNKGKQFSKEAILSQSFVVLVLCSARPM